MLEEMRDAGLAGRIVGGAVAVPDHVGDDGGAPVGDDDDGQPVLQPEGFNRLGGLARTRVHVHLEPTPAVGRARWRVLPDRAALCLAPVAQGGLGPARRALTRSA